MNGVSEYAEIQRRLFAVKLPALVGNTGEGTVVTFILDCLV